jgi:hypothetical protein
MLTVIIDARTKADRLPMILAQLTAGAVDGLVRQVLLVAANGQAGIDELCEETGAETHPSIPAAATAARADVLMVLPADFRLRDGWIQALGGQAPPAVITGLGDAGLLKRPPTGVLVERALVGRAQQGVDTIQGLRRQLGLRVRRIG